MITFAWYLLKVIICSGILCGYYYLALRNKIFHRWNRFYLLASVVLALAVPLMKINIFQRPNADKGTVIRLLQTINNSDEIIVEYSRNNGQPSSENIIEATYLSISTVLLFIFFFSLYKISRLRKKYPETKLKGINFISTDASGTPFSFFNTVFWNNAIDLHSRQGHQIFNHEIAHIKEKHTYDKVFMNVVLLFFWINPFFWLMQKELGMIHEFIADKEALEDNDINAFAEMILQTVYPGQHFSITNNFFHSPLKRRLTMFTKNKNPKVSYASRLLVLPLAAVVFFAFTLKMKTTSIANYYSGKKITVVIDAGHGGGDYGAIANDIKEKDLNLSIAKEIKELNKNENLNIILSREGDITLTPQDRVKFADVNKADLFISIHVDAEENKNTHSGLSILIPKEDNAYLKESKLLGSAIVASFKNKYPLQVNDYLQQLKGGVWVLKANQYPSVLIETCFLTTQTDFDYIVKPQNQQTIARNILNGIEKYAEKNMANKASNVSATLDTIPESSSLFVVDGKIVPAAEGRAINPASIQSVHMLKGENAIKKYGEKGKEGVVEITMKSSAGVRTVAAKKVPEVPEVHEVPEVQDNETIPVYFVDEKEVSKSEINHIPASNIESITVLKSESATKKYGEKGKNGVVEITSKPPHDRELLKKELEIKLKELHAIQADTIPAMLFTKVENEAEFPGGREAWFKYIASQVQKNQDKFTSRDFGTCLVKFIVNTDGSVTNVEDSTMKDTQLANVAVEAIRSGPKWIPATQNGHIVASYRLQPVTFTNPK